MSDITRYRGDTRRIRKTVRDGNGVALPITGWSFVLTVDEREGPDDDTTVVAQVLGVIYDAPNGVVDFTPAAVDVDVAGTYYFDIQAVDADGGITTLDKARFTLLQDITKSVPEPPASVFTNLLLNDGFEAAATGWTSVPGGGVVQYPYPAPKSGTYSGYVQAQVDVAASYFEQAVPDIVGSTWYRLSGWCKAGGGGWFTVIANPSGTPMMTELQVGGDSSYWLLSGREFYTPPGTTELVVRLGGATLYGSTLFDNMELINTEEFS